MSDKPSLVDTGWHRTADGGISACFSSGTLKIQDLGGLVKFSIALPDGSATSVTIDRTAFFKAVDEEFGVVR